MKSDEQKVQVTIFERSLSEIRRMMFLVQVILDCFKSVVNTVINLWLIVNSFKSCC